jgi:hypothetical protein
MKTLMWVLVAGAALVSLPAQAAHHRHAGANYYYRPHVSLGLRFGYPYYWYDPWYYSSFGFSYPLWPPPHRVDRARSDREESAPAMAKLYVYPAAGQTAEQLGQDRYECHVWAVDQSGYDPTVGKGTADQGSDYSRAFVACLEGRHYVVK